MALDINTFANLVKIYQTNIDSLLLTMGKPVVLYFKNTVANVNNDFKDPVRPDNIRKPSYKETSVDEAPIISENTKTIKALIKYEPKDFQNFGLRIDNPAGIVRLKTFLTDAPDLKRCEFVIPSADSNDIIDAKYKLLRGPIPIGLQKDRYCVTYWIRI